MKRIYLNIVFIMCTNFVSAQLDTLFIDSISDFGEVLPNLTVGFHQFQKHFVNDSYYIVNSRIRDTFLMKGEIKNQLPTGLWFFNDILKKHYYTIDFDDLRKHYSIDGFDDSGQLIYQLNKFDEYSMEKIVENTMLYINESKLNNQHILFSKWRQYDKGKLVRYYYEDSLTSIDEEYQNSRIYKAEYHRLDLKDSIWILRVSDQNIDIKISYKENKIEYISINNNLTTVPSPDYLKINFKTNNHIIQIEIANFELNGLFEIKSIYKDDEYIMRIYNNGLIVKNSFSKLNWN